MKKLAVFLTSSALLVGCLETGSDPLANRPDLKSSLGTKTEFNAIESSQCAVIEEQANARLVDLKRSCDEQNSSLNIEFSGKIAEMEQRIEVCATANNQTVAQSRENERLALEARDKQEELMKSIQDKYTDTASKLTSCIQASQNPNPLKFVDGSFVQIDMGYEGGKSVLAPTQRGYDVVDGDLTLEIPVSVRFLTDANIQVSGLTIAAVGGMRDELTQNELIVKNEIEVVKGSAAREFIIKFKNSRKQLMASNQTLRRIIISVVPKMSGATELLPGRQVEERIQLSIWNRSVGENVVKVSQEMVQR